LRLIKAHAGLYSSNSPENLRATFIQVLSFRGDGSQEVGLFRPQRELKVRRKNADNGE
jgi:hypothetical protein